MKKIFVTLTLILVLPSVSYPTEIDKKWSNEDLFLFSAVITSQIADYTQSIKFNQYITKNECRYLDVPDVYILETGKSIARWIECTERRYIRGEEGNPLVRRADGGFDSDRAILLATALDTSLFLIATKYPKWRKPLLYLVYSIEMLAIWDNHSKGFKADTPIFPVIWTWRF